MIPLRLTSPCAATTLTFKPPLTSTFGPLYTYHHSKKLNHRRFKNGMCRVEFSHDAPIGVAIGACILNSLVFPITPCPDDDEGDSVIDSADARFAVMAIISFIPYFNWLSWVFAWLDTGKRRYAVYAIVYLAPYLRSNLSLSPEESWLPIISILLCIIHIQLEASIKNGDLEGFQLFSGSGKHLLSVSRKKESRISKEERKKDHMNLPSAQDQSRNVTREWGDPRKPLKDPEHLGEDGAANGEGKH
ncbi:unnamed protein product [Ilex paraguariensis]|uniref:Uncharacterized protein n=1 Tax=Ilex paraguariensis TaxID=185542 RepID=A0ABC8RZU9_9AQUA